MHNIDVNSCFTIGFDTKPAQAIRVVYRMWFFVERSKLENNDDQR